MNIDINTLRALVTATNSLRYNPDIDPDVAITYELLLYRLRDELSNELEVEEGGSDMREARRHDKD